MLPPYVIGCTARDVYTWRWRYITLCEREENQSTLSVHVSRNFTYCNCCVQRDGVCADGLCSAGRLPDGWCSYGYEITLCALLWPRGGTSQVEHEANCSLMITNTQVKLKTLYPGTAVIFCCTEQRVKRFFPHTVGFFP